MSIKKRMLYYFGTSSRRKILDNLLEENKNYFKGSILDIGGGRKRGNFNPPKTEKWIFADITPELNPDIICNVEKMQFGNASFDTIKATELFEHVEKPEDGIRECYRVLKTGGYFIISVPFLCPIHGDPHDFQRWTDKKWGKVLIDTGFQIKKIESMGGYFTVLSEMLKSLNTKLPLVFRCIGYIFYPFLDFINRIDKTKISLTKNYTTGYFIIAFK